MTLDGSSARTRNEGGGFAANIYGAMPESGGGSDTGETHFQHTVEPTPSRYARQPLPEEGARMWGVSSVSIPPSFGRRCPQGGGWATQSGVKRSVSSRRFTKAPYPPLTRSPFPDGEGKLVAASLQNRKGDARRSLKCCLRTSPPFILCGASIFLCAAPLNLEHRVE